MSIILVITLIGLVIQALNMQKCDDCAPFSVLWHYPSRYAYSLSIVAILNSIFMILVNLWLLWGIRKEKASVVLSWAVISAMWLTQTFCMLIVLICMYSSEANFIAWLLSFIFGLVAIGVLLYCLLVVFGYWLELKQSTPSSAELRETNK